MLITNIMFNIFLYHRILSVIVMYFKIQLVIICNFFTLRKEIYNKNQ